MARGMGRIRKPPAKPGRIGSRLLMTFFFRLYSQPPSHPGALAALSHRPNREVPLHAGSSAPWRFSQLNHMKGILTSYPLPNAARCSRHIPCHPWLQPRSIRPFIIMHWTFWHAHIAQGGILQSISAWITSVEELALALSHTLYPMRRAGGLTGPIDATQQ